MSYMTNIQKLYILIGVSILIIVVFCLIAYHTELQRRPELGLWEFVIGEDLSFNSILVGMSSGVIFGILDNGGLFFGMDALDPFLPKGKLIPAGLGGTFSNVLGTASGAYAGVVVKNLFDFKGEHPVWTEMIGMLLGCFLGIYIPHMITGKK